MPSQNLLFLSYRFSEDLDFSYMSDEPAGDAIPSVLPRGIETTRSLLQEEGPFVIDLVPARHQSDHPAGQLEYQIRIQFPWMRTLDCAVKLEITTDEPVLRPAIQLPIQHAFSESIEGTLNSYTMEEIVAEKLRALLQKRRQLDDRGWMSNRARCLRPCVPQGPDRMANRLEPGRRNVAGQGGYQGCLVFSWSRLPRPASRGLLASRLEVARTYHEECSQLRCMHRECAMDHQECRSWRVMGDLLRCIF